LSEEKIYHGSVLQLLNFITLQQLEEKRAVVSKRGVDDGNQKGGGFPQPAQESQFHFNTTGKKVKFFL